MVRLCVVAMAMLAELPGTASTGLWKAAHRGDVRAELTVPSSLSKQLLSATIVWRRRDANPAQKRVLVTDSNDNEISSHVAVIEQHQGVVLFTPPSPGTYYVYWLPYVASNNWPYICSSSSLSCSSSSMILLSFSLSFFLSPFPPPHQYSQYNQKNLFSCTLLFHPVWVQQVHADWYWSHRL